MANTRITGLQTKDGSLTEADLSLSDVTTLNASTSQHGFMSKFPNAGRQYLQDDGTWSYPGASVTTVTSSATPTPAIVAGSNMYIITALAAAATFGSPTGSPVQGQMLLIRIKDNGTAQTLAFNAIFRAIGVTLPITTVVSKTMYVLCIYNSTDTKWDVVSIGQEA